MEADTPPTVAKPTAPKNSPPTPNLLVSQVLGKQSTREVLHALHDLTHFGLCELEMLLQQFTRRSNGTHTISKASFVEEMGHAFGIADEVTTPNPHPTTQTDVASCPRSFRNPPPPFHLSDSTPLREPLWVIRQSSPPPRHGLWAGRV